MTTPDFLPSLAAGAHDADDGEACVMEYVSLLAGEGWSDRPECTHPLLAHEARMLNDDLDDRDRHLLVPLIGRLFGTTAESPVVTVRLRLGQVAGVLRLLEPSARARLAPLVARAESEAAALARRAAEAGGDDALALEGAAASLEAESVAEARELARSFPVGESEGDTRHAAHHTATARGAWFALVGDLCAAEAWALAAFVAAHRVAAAGECRADCGDTSAHARLRVRELSDLLDAYDRATGREERRLTTAEVRELADLVG